MSVTASDRYRSGARVGLHFHIKLHEDDKRLLEKVKETLQCGNVYYQKEQRENHAQCYRYTVGSHRDIIGKIIPFFEKHPLQSHTKKKSFALFRKIAKKVEAGEHLTKQGIKEIRALKERLN